LLYIAYYHRPSCRNTRSLYRATGTTAHTGTASTASSSATTAGTVLARVLVLDLLLDFLDSTL
jgi:hypothetical protein